MIVKESVGVGLGVRVRDRERKGGRERKIMKHSFIWITDYL